MSAAKTGGSGSTRKRGAAARAETNGQPRVVDFRGLELKLPPELPGEVIFDIADLETATGPGPFVRMLGSLLGPDQLLAVRAKIAEEKIPLAEAETTLIGLIHDSLDKYGLSMGESSASPDS